MSFDDLIRDELDPDGIIKGSSDAKSLISLYPIVECSANALNVKRWPRQHPFAILSHVAFIHDLNTCKSWNPRWHQLYSNLLVNTQRETHFAWHGIVRTRDGAE